MIAMKGRLPSNPLAEVAASEQMRPKFLEMTPLEVGPFAEEDSFIHMTVIVVGMEQRAKVKGNVWNASVGERLTVTDNGCLDVVVLVVKHQSDEIVVGFSTDVARLVDKDRKHLHGDNPLETKMPGNPPALDSPLKRDDQGQYSMPLRFAAVPFRNHYGKDVAL